MMQKLLAAIAAEPYEVNTKGSGLLHITSKFAVHQWIPGQTPEKVLRLVDVFCASQRIDTEEEEGVEVE